MKDMLILAILLTTFPSIVSAQTTSISAVDSNSCQTVEGQMHPFILVLKKGENLLTSLSNCMTAAHLNSASINGLGALQNPTLAYFNMQTKSYQYKQFPGIFEITALNGNITEVDGKPFPHVHVTLGDSSYHMIGGHLKTATIGATAEITVIPLATPIHRRPDPTVGAQLIQTQ